MKYKPDDGKDSGNSIKDYAPYIGLGLQLAVTIVAMVFLGIWLDDKFDTKPTLTIVCSFFGVFTALYNFIRTALKSDK